MKNYDIYEQSYLPHQPYLELNSKYHAYRPLPGSPLHEIVWEAYQVDHYDLSKDVTFPDACADLMVFYTDNCSMCYIMSSDTGTHTMADMAFMKNVKTIFGVRFCTGYVGDLFRKEIRDVEVNQIDGSYAFVNGKEDLKKLLYATDFKSRWEIMEGYILRRLVERKETNGIVEYIMKRIVDCRGNLKVLDLADETGYTDRYLRKMVKESTGASIKQLCDVTRFQWSYHLYKESEGNIKFVDLALQSGYYDQNHMNRSCRKISGEIPRKIFNIYMK